VEDARDYIRKGPIQMYERLGFGLYLAERKEGNVPIGICGLLKRDELEDVDLGFALLPAFRGKGYAFEAASAAMAYGRSVLGLNRIVAIASPANWVSARLLAKLGFQPEAKIRLGSDGPELQLFAAGLKGEQ
jgi:RimJ/RimL family protein N-acetyltransferase